MKKELNKPFPNPISKPIIIIINYACIAHITFREKSLCALRMKNTEGSKVKMGQVIR